MFNVENYNIATEDIPIINYGYHVLHFDDEPILYYGYNIYDTLIIGSLVEEDYEEKIQRFFHTPISKKQLYSFEKNKITYRDIIKDAPKVYIIDKRFTGELLNIYNTKGSNIPPDYLPTERSYYPIEEEESSLKYGVKLKGFVADRALIKMEEQLLCTEVTGTRSARNKKNS